MAPAGRRQFVHQTALAAAALWSASRVGIGAEDPGNEGGPVDAGAIRKLVSAVEGRVITPEAADYDSARLVFNRAFDRRPALIVRCAGPSDVARALEFAQARNLPLAVRAGGHSRIGYGVCDGGVVIDMSGLRRVEVDAKRRVARAQAGALVRDLDEATQRRGLATTSGGCPTVGLAGFTLGGGEGRLMEKYGAACDNLLSAQVVTVDGRRVEASSASHADLFWAIRGGGGNFGVVTSLEYRLHPLGDVFAGSLVYPPGRIPELLQAFDRFLAGAPDEMDALAQLLPSEHGPRLKIDLCYCGDPRTGAAMSGPLRALGPQEDSARVMPYLEAQAAGGFLQKPVAHFQTNVFLRELSEQALAAIGAAIDHAPARCKVIVVPLRGAVSRVSVSETAFCLRQPGYEIDMTGVWNTPEEKAESVRWVEVARDSLRPLASGVYVNQLGDTSDQLVRSGYGPNYARLVEIKKKYDPANVLRLNQNVRPDSPL